jgi:hypothetical protein
MPPSHWWGILDWREVALVHSRSRPMHIRLAHLLAAWVCIGCGNSPSLRVLPFVTIGQDRLDYCMHLCTSSLVCLLECHYVSTPDYSVAADVCSAGDRERDIPLPMAKTPSVVGSPGFRPTPSLHRLALCGYLMSVGSHITGVSFTLSSENFALLHLASGPRSDAIAASGVPVCLEVGCVALPWPI